MNPAEAEVLAPFERKITQREGDGQKWQVEPKDIRLMVEENLLGKRIVKQVEYALVSKEDLEKKDSNKGSVAAITTFWHHDEEEAAKEAKVFCEDNGVFTADVQLIKTGQSRKKTARIKEPLMNETGAYHCLSIIEGIFSRMGYLSNLSGNEINDIIYDDVLTKLVISIMKNHKRYGIDKGSRDEIIGFFTSTCQLILNSSREGWTGNRFSNTVQEQIVTKQEGEKGGMVKKIFG